MRCNQSIPPGQPRPRTCAKCGLGPCKEAQRQEHAQVKAICGLIQKLSYRDMRSFAGCLALELGEVNAEEKVSDALLALSDKILRDEANRPIENSVTGIRQAPGHAGYRR